MSIMSNEHPLISPKYAAGCLPHFTGDSFDACTEDAIKCLSKFGYSPTTMKVKNLHSLSSSNHQQFRKRPGMTQKFYCTRCTTHNSATHKEFSNYRCCVIATFIITKAKDGSVYTLTIDELYPHAKDCMQHDLRQHMRTIIRQESHGKGYWIFDIDFENVIGDVFHPILDKLQGLSKDDLGIYDTCHGKVIICTYFSIDHSSSPHFVVLYSNSLHISLCSFFALGKKITSGVADGNTPELRWYFLLQPEVNDKTQELINRQYDLDTPKFSVELNKLIGRLSIVLANDLNIANELNFQQVEYPHNIPSNQSHIAPHHPHTSSQHLRLTNPSIIFGGYNGAHTQKTVHQTPHMDYAPVNDVHLSESDKFRFDWKPSSVIIPLEDERNVIIYSDIDGKMTEEMVKVSRGQMLVLEGDKVHGGESYDAPKQNPSLHPALHLYLYSRQHPCDLNTFTISTNHCVKHPHFHGHLQNISEENMEEELKTALDVSAGVVKTIHQHGQISNEQIVQHLRQFLEQLPDDIKNAIAIIPPKRRSTRRKAT